MPKDVADVLAKLAFKEQQAEAADRSKQKNEEKQKRDRDRNRLSLQNKKTEEADRTQYKPLVPYSPAPTPTAFGAENVDDYTSWSLDHLQSERDRINGTIAQNEVQIARTIDPVARQKLIDETDALRGTVDSLEKQIHVRRPASVVSEEATAASEKKKRGVWDAIMGALNSYTQAELATASSLTGKKEKAEGYENTAESEMERSIAGSAAHREGRAEEKALNAELLDAREGNHLTTNERYEKTTRYRELSQSVVARMFNADELSDEEKKQLEADTAELKQLQSELGSDYLNGIERVGAGIQGALYGIEKGLASDVAWLGEKAPQMAGNILFQGGGPMGDIAGILLQAGAPYLRKFAGIMSEKQQDIQKLANKNATSGEKTSYNAVQSGTEMAFDTGMAALTGVGGLTYMGLRVFGGSSQDALDAGASEAQAIAYAATHAGIEVLSEKMFDVMGIYGGGYGDDLAKNVIARTTSNPALAKLMVIAFAGIEEPIEEVASGIADPAAEFWINGEKLTAENLLSKYDAEWAGEIGEAMLVANILGTLGGTVEVTRNGIQSRNGNALEIGSEEWRQEIMSPKVRKSLEDAGIDIGEVEQAIAEAQQALVDRVTEIETQETHGPRGHSASTHTEEGRTPAQQALHDMDISDGATSANVAEILSSPELKAEFEQIAGVKIEGTPEQQAQIIQDNAQKVGEYVGYKYAESPTETTATETVEESEPAKALAPTIEEQREEQRQLRQEETPAEVPTETPVADALAPTVNNEAETETVNEASEALAPEEQTEQPAEEAPAEEAPTEEAEPKPEETKKQTPKEKVRGILQKGDKITDADMAYILGHDSAYEALRDYGIDPDRELVGSDRQRKAALRGLAADLLNNGELPSVEAVQQLKEENQHRSTEHLFLDEIHRLDEQIEAARLQGDTERVNDLTARKENYSKKLDATREILNKYKQQQKAKKEAAKVKEISGKISDIVNKLTTASSNPSEGNYVPRGARTIVTDAISLITRSQSDSAAAASQARRAEIAEKIQNAKTLKEAEKLLGQWSRISNSEMRQQAKFSRILDAVEELKSSKYYENDLMGAEVLQDKLATISESLGDTPFYEMDSEQLGQVYDAVKAINNYVRNAVRTRIAGENRVAYEVEQEMRQEVVNARTAAKNSITSVIRDANMGFLNSKNVFNLLGGRHADSMFNKFQNGLNEAQKRQNAMLLDGMDKIMPLVNDNKNFKTQRKKVTVEGFVDENGKKIPMTRGTMLYLDMLLDMEDGARSVSYAGLDFPGLFGFLHDIDSRGWGSSHKRMGGIAGEVATLQHEWKTLTKDLNTELKKSNKDDAWKQRVTQMTEQLDDLETRIDVARKEAGIDTATLKANLDAELTDYEKQMLAAMREGFDFARERINDMMEDVFGFSGANVENYVPMYRDPNFRKVSLDTFKADVASEQWGNMKKRVEFASQPLRAMDIYEVYQSYMKKASVYAEVMPAVRNFMKVWNTTEATDTESGQIESLRNSIRDKFGEKPIKYIEGLLQAIQGGGQTVDDISFIPKLIAKTRGNLAKSALRVGNIGVQWSQLASLASGSKYIPLRYIAKAAVSTEQKSTREFINQYSAYLRDRMANNSVFRAETQTIDDMIDRADWLSGGIQRNDLNAVTTLWKAAEYMVESEEGLTRGDPGFGERVAEVWEKTLDDTQPMWSPMQRPANLRSPSEIVKAFMMFKTQPMQHYNMLYEATANLEQANADLNAAKKGGDTEAIEQAKAGLKERQSEAGRTYAAVALANATYTILRTVADGLIHKWDKFRDKETGEVTAEQIGKRMAWLLGETTAGCVPFGDILFGVLETAVTGEYYFGISLAGIDNINTALTKTTDLLKSIGEVELSDKEISEAKKEKLKKNAYASAKAIGEAFGLSINNVEKLVKGAEQWVGDIKTIIDNDVTLSEIWHGDYRGEYYDFSASQNKNQAIDALLDGNDKKLDRIMRRMEEGHDEGYAKQQVAAAIKESYSAEDVDYSTAKNMLVRTGYTDTEADKTILGWHTDGIYDDKRSDWEKSREGREDTDLDLDLDRARGMEGFADLGAGSQKEVLDDVYNYYKHLENKEYAEANGIEYENTKYEKYEDLDDPVARMVLEQTLNPAIEKDKKDPSEIANPDVVDALVGKYIAGDMSDEDKAWFEEHDYARDLIAGAQLDKPIDADTYFDILDFVQDLSKDTSKMKNEGIDERDYKAIDETIKALAPILDSDEAIDIFSDSYTWTDELIDAAAIGMDSKTFYKYFDQYNAKKEDESLTPKDVYDDMYRIVEDATDLTREQKEFLHDRLGVYQMRRMGDTTFEKFVDKGMPTEYAEKYLDIWADEKAKLNEDLKPGEKEKDLSDTDKLRIIWRDDSIEDVHVKLDYIFATHYAPRQHDFAIWLGNAKDAGNLTMSEVYSYWSKFRDEYWPNSDTTWQQAKNRRR